jgi:hypothetical protein
MKKTETKKSCATVPLRKPIEKSVSKGSVTGED